MLVGGLFWFDSCSCPKELASTVTVIQIGFNSQRTYPEIVSQYSPPQVSTVQERWEVKITNTGFNTIALFRLQMKKAVIFDGPLEHRSRYMLFIYIIWVATWAPSVRPPRSSLIPNIYIRPFLENWTATYISPCHIVHIYRDLETNAGGISHKAVYGLVSPLFHDWMTAYLFPSSMHSVFDARNHPMVNEPWTVCIKLFLVSMIWMSRLDI